MNDKGRKKKLNCGKCLQRTEKNGKVYLGPNGGGGGKGEGGGRAVKLVSKAQGKCK